MTTDTLSRGYICARLYLRGRTLREIAWACGCSHETVRQELLQRGVEMRPRGRKRHV